VGGTTGAAGVTGAAGGGVAGNFVPCPAKPPATSVFLAPTVVAIPTDQWPESLALGDLNGDGLEDLVIGGSKLIAPGAAGVSGSSLQGTLNVVLADKTVGFAPGVRHDGFDPSYLAIADLNGDKLPDVVSQAYSGPVMSLNAGGGALALPTSFPLPSALLYRGLATADFDGDGRSEMVIPTENPDDGPGAGVVLLKSNGAGDYAQQKLDDGVNAKAVAVGDVDGQAGPDLVVAGNVPNGQGALHVLLNDGSGQLGSLVDLSGVVGAVSVTLVDLDGDGKLDIVVQQPGFADGYGAYSNQGGGRFGAMQALPLGDSSGSTAFGDVDGDGKVDAVVSSNACSSLSLYLNDGKGSFLAPSRISDASPGHLALGDFNGDKALDLVYITERGVVVQLHRAP
jgi:hypothetical protein